MRFQAGEATPCVKKQDFLTYSTYHMVDQHVVFGGTRWGGSFWHHNLEAPLTVQDMTRWAPGCIVGLRGRVSSINILQRHTHGVHDLKAQRM